MRDLPKFIERKLTQDVSGASLAAFRIGFGLVMFWHAIAFLLPQGDTNLKDYLYHSPEHNFTYPAFQWVTVFGEPWWTLFFITLAVASLLLAAGILYRASAITVCLVYSYIFLSEAAKYNNHYYLMCLLAFLLIWLPGNRRFSLIRSGSAKRTTVPFAAVFVLRAQLFIVYFYGGLAKINSDWLTGIPMIGKGQEVLDFWGPLLGSPEVEAIVVARSICWIGLIYDLSIGFLLLNRRTRLLGFLLTAVFHLSNHFLFSIGVFPWMALATTLIFLEPDWPERFLSWIRRPRFRAPEWRWSSLGIVLIPVLGFSLGWKDRKSGWKDVRYPLARTACLVGGIFLALQLILPFRHFTIAGDANWTEEGQDFSWRMMLRAKDASHVIYRINDASLLNNDGDPTAPVNWEVWPEGKPKLLYVPVDADRFDWSQHPGLTVIHEPVLGRRIIYRLGDESFEDARGRIREMWSSALGRTVEINEGITLSSWCSAIPNLDPERRGFSDETLQNLRTRISSLSDVGAARRENLLASLVRDLDLLTSRESVREARELLTRLRPFVLQGAEGAGRFLILSESDQEAEPFDLNRMNGGKEVLVWIDLGRLRPDDWRSLPRWFIALENQEVIVLWNYMDQLNDIQHNRFSTSPWMIRQLGRSIASEWEAEMGTRPIVTVASNIMLNYRLPQPLVDPNVDIASVPYSLFRHNEWILPVDSSVGSATRSANGRE